MEVLSLHEEIDMCILPENPRSFIPGIVSHLSHIWEDLLHLAARCTYKKGRYFSVKEEAPDSFGYIRSGRISAFHQSYLGDTKVSFIMGSGTLFCETYACSGFVYNFPMNICMSDAEIYYFPSRLFRDEAFINSHQKYIYNALYSIAVKHTLRDTLEDIATRKNIHEKVAAWIYIGHKTLRTKIFTPSISQLELAFMLGVHKSSINRAILYLKQHGAISTFTKSNIVILDEQKLLKIAHGRL